jgi:hypothetical protein
MGTFIFVVEDVAEHFVFLAVHLVLNLHNFAKQLIFYSFELWEKFGLPVFVVGDHILVVGIGSFYFVDLCLIGLQLSIKRVYLREWFVLFLVELAHHLAQSFNLSLLHREELLVAPYQVLSFLLPRSTAGAGMALLSLGLLPEGIFSDIGVFGPALFFIVLHPSYY